MKSAFDVARKYLQSEEHTREQSPQAAGATEGPIIAVLIASTVLDADIWLALDEDFKPDDGLAVFYPDELSFLKDKDPETLREIHKQKLTFGGGRVTQ